MARSTLTLLFVLGTISSFLVGINIGKKLPGDASVLSSQDIQQSLSTTTHNPEPTTIPSPTPRPKRLSPTPAAQTTNPPSREATARQSNTSLRTIDGITTLTDRDCGLSVRFPESFTRQKTGNANSKIFTDPQRPGEMIAIVCQDAIPEPPVSLGDTESTTLAGVSATLYHDQYPDGSPRDEIIARHPTMGHDIIIAGWGPAFDEAVSSFKFLK